MTRPAPRGGTTLPHLIDRFAGCRTTVIGEAMLDVYLHGTSSRLNREAPVPIVNIADRFVAPGGAANTAVNAHNLGSDVTFLSVVGDDEPGRELRNALDESGVDTHHVLVRAARETLTKQRIMVGSHMVVRFDQGDNDPLDGETEEALLRALERFFLESDVVIISDYDYGIVTPRIIHRLAELQAAAPRILVADSKHLDTYRSVGMTAVKPNYGEVTHLLNVSPCGSCIRAEQIIEHGEQILELTGAQIAAVTLDTEGALVFESGAPPYRTYARPRPHSHAAGAGDTFLATFALALAVGAHTPAAAELASGAAAIVVSRDGTTTIGASELREFFTVETKIAGEPDRLKTRLEYYRQEGRRIVFTNGVFDILHRGHITYLNRAKALGDVLIVGVNSDESVSRLKGPTRPINSVEDRQQVLAALSCIDHIIAFDDDTPAELIRMIRPDVYVKGGDYTRQTLPETPIVEQLGGVVHILPYVQDRSTTGIIERIREADGPSTAQPGRDKEHARDAG